MGKPIIVIGNKGTWRVEGSVEGGSLVWVLTSGARRMEMNDRGYALDVARHFAEHGSEGMVA